MSDLRSDHVKPVISEHYHLCIFCGEEINGTPWVFKIYIIEGVSQVVPIHVRHLNG